MFIAWIINSLSNGHFENSDCDQIVVLMSVARALLILLVNFAKCSCLLYG